MKRPPRAPPGQRAGRVWPVAPGDRLEELFRSFPLVVGARDRCQEDAAGGLGEPAAVS